MGYNSNNQKAIRNINQNKGFMCPVCEAFIQPGYDYCPVCGEMPGVDSDDGFLGMLIMFWLVFIAPFASALTPLIYKINGSVLTGLTLFVLCIMELISVTHLVGIIRDWKKSKRGIIKLIWRTKWSVWVIYWLSLSIYHLYGHFLFK